MPYFRVLVEGKNITVPMGESTAIGFFTTRAVRAGSEAEAVEKVRSMIPKPPLAARLERRRGMPLLADSGHWAGVGAGAMSSKPSMQ